MATIKGRIALLLCVLGAGNILLWLLAWAGSARDAAFLGTALLAYGFGLRHAVDADHIAAIDNTIRRLMRDGKRPIGVGFFFSLGHSTVVLLLCAGLAVAAPYVTRHMAHWGSIGSTAGTVISGGSLYLIGLINLVVLVDAWRAYRARSTAGEDSQPFLEQKGLLTRILRPLLALVRRSWQMYFIGFLFGLGFDTATEVGLLALSAKSGQAGLPLLKIMLLPLLFTAGMCLVDTLDGILMLGAYGWATIQPGRKLAYSIVITGVSVLVAFVVGTNELVQDSGDSGRRERDRRICSGLPELPEPGLWNSGAVLVDMGSVVFASETQNGRREITPCALRPRH